MSANTSDKITTLKRLPNTPKALGPIPSTAYTGVAAHDFNPTARSGVESGGSEVQCHPLLHSQFKTSLKFNKTLSPEPTGEERNNKC